MHFFNPVPVLELVEVIRALQTSDETAAAIVGLARDLGKEPAEANDSPGFVSNRILMPFINEAAYALMEGVAEPEAIDTIAKLGFAHPMGPLALADLIGLDTCVAIMEVLHEGSETRSTHRARCYADMSRPAGSAARAAAASTSTCERRRAPAPGPHRRRKGPRRCVRRRLLRARAPAPNRRRGTRAVVPEAAPDLEAAARTDGSRTGRSSNATHVVAQAP